MYRAVTFAVLENGSSISRDHVLDLLPALSMELKYEQGQMHVYLNGNDVTGQLRSPEVSDNVSFVSSLPAVREKLVEFQRKSAIAMVEEGTGVVMDGRDIGTIVFPDADLKFFMSAPVEVRAQRRYRELLEQGVEISLEEVMSNVAARDERDSKRAIAPLCKAEDAILIDTSTLSFDEQVLLVIEKVKERLVKQDV